MNTVYSVLSDDPTNDRANDIINAFDSLPIIKYTNMTQEQKLKFADYILNWLKKEKLLKKGSNSIDQEQLEETCMAGDTICEALVEAGIISGIGC